MAKKGELAKKDQFEVTMENIPEMLKKVSDQILALKGDMPETNSTEGKSLPNFGRVKEITSLASLIKARSMVENKAESYNTQREKIAKLKGWELKKLPAFTLEGVGEEKWLADIDYQIGVTANKTFIAKLEKIKSKLEANLSAEEKFKRDMADIAKTISGDFSDPE